MSGARNTIALSVGAVAGLVTLVASAAARADEALSISNMPTGRYHIDKSHTHVNWAISHVGFSQTLGRFDDIDGFMELDSKNPAKSTMEIDIDPASIDANNKKLEDELRSADFFDVSKYPDLKFVFESFQQTGPDAGYIKGRMTLHGVTKPISFEAKLNKVLPTPQQRKFTRMGFSAQATIDRTEWGMTYLDLVGHQVEIRVEAEFLIDDG